MTVLKIIGKSLLGLVSLGGVVAGVYLVHFGLYAAAHTSSRPDLRGLNLLVVPGVWIVGFGLVGLKVAITGQLWKIDTAEQANPNPTFAYREPPAKLTFGRWLLARLPRFCRYCGRHYVKCYGGPERFNVFVPLGEDGRCCPDGHVGYLDAFNGYCMSRTIFDNVKAKAENAAIPIK